MDIKQVKGFYFRYETHLELKVQLCHELISVPKNS